MLGIQFDCLFENDLYLSYCKNAIDQADKIREAFKSKGYELVYENETNQVFVLLNQIQIDKIKRKVEFALGKNMMNKIIFVVLRLVGQPLINR